ncbi:hypothetical protein [Salinicola sp. MIT1003]|uniref:hypothetical protein n=1 Tax=Salinicola sp. MIT1003 TaxID=1882734 RepID=UPI0008DE0580|nr:hypothetical protein [Salinicola sp. MIT1003]OHZ03004.1 hypothetical protein BC443_15045 [Salinicola sp. MIT1003]
MTEEQIEANFGMYGALVVAKGLITRERLIELARKYPGTFIAHDRSTGHYQLHMPSQKTDGKLVLDLHTHKTVQAPGKPKIDPAKRKAKAVSFKLTESQHSAIQKLVGSQESPGQLARRLVSEYLEQHA